MSENADWSIVVAAKWASAAVVSYWLGLGQSIQVLLWLMALDFSTGIISGIVDRELSSKRASLGIAKKAGALIIISAVHLVSDVAGNHFAMPLELGSIVAWFYVLSEFISIVENCSRLGAPVPPILLDTIRRAKRLQERQEAAIIEVKEKQQAAVESMKEAQKATKVLEKTLPDAEVKRPEGS